MTPARVRVCILSVLLVAISFQAAADDIEDYFAFNGPATGVILPAQITSDLMASIRFVDVRDAQSYAEGHLPGAVNFPWAEAIDRRHAYLGTAKIVLYCETGVQSAQIMLALRLLGHDATVLQGGYRAWQSAGN